WSASNPVLAPPRWPVPRQRCAYWWVLPFGWVPPHAHSRAGLIPRSAVNPLAQEIGVAVRGPIILRHGGAVPAQRDVDAAPLAQIRVVEGHALDRLPGQRALALERGEIVGSAGRVGVVPVAVLALVRAIEHGQVHLATEPAEPPPLDLGHVPH